MAREPERSNGHGGWASADDVVASMSTTTRLSSPKYSLMLPPPLMLSAVAEGPGLPNHPHVVDEAVCYGHNEKRN